MEQLFAELDVALSVNFTFISSTDDLIRFVINFSNVDYKGLFLKKNTAFGSHRIAGSQCYCRIDLELKLYHQTEMAVFSLYHFLKYLAHWYFFRLESAMRDCLVM